MCARTHTSHVHTYTHTDSLTHMHSLSHTHVHTHHPPTHTPPHPSSHTHSLSLQRQRHSNLEATYREEDSIDVVIAAINWSIQERPTAVGWKSNKKTHRWANVQMVHNQNRKIITNFFEKKAFVKSHWSSQIYRLLLFYYTYSYLSCKPHLRTHSHTHTHMQTHTLSYTHTL